MNKMLRVSVGIGLTQIFWTLTQSSNPDFSELLNQLNYLVITY